MKRYFHIISVEEKVNYNDTDDCVEVNGYMKFKGSLLAKVKAVDLTKLEYYYVYINDVTFESFISLDYEKEINGCNHVEFTINKPYIKDSLNPKDHDFYIKTCEGKEDDLCKNLNRHQYKMDNLIESIFSFFLYDRRHFCIIDV